MKELEFRVHNIVQILGQMKFKKESHYLELGETGLTKNLSTTGG